MKTALFATVDTISVVLGYVAQAMVLILIGSMLYEVVARYVFGAPTLWAFDIAYMSTGALFILGAAQALREDAHVRIDFLSTKLPPRVRHTIEGIIFLLVLTPIFAMLTYVAGQRTLRAWTTGEVEHVSPWAPVMWPFYSALAIGLAALTLQLAIEGMRAFTTSKTDNSFKIET